MIVENKRLHYVDVCKSLGIILVILGHTDSLPESLDISIYSFHMPLFFILTGFVYNREKNRDMGFRRFAAKVFRRYLVPYYTFSFVNLILEVLSKTLYWRETLTLDYFFVKIRGILLCYSNMANTPNCTPVWFLMCLFFANLLFWLINKLDFKFTWIPILVCVIANYLVLPYCHDYTSFPFKFPTFLLATFFLYVGFVFNKLLNLKPIFLRNKISSIILSAIIIVISISVVVFTDNRVGMNENHYDNYLISLCTSTLISLSFIMLFKNFTLFENKFFTWLGQNTIYVVGFNYVCRDLATELYYFLIVGMTGRFIPILRDIKMHWFVNFMLTFVLCLVCIIVCTSTKSLLSHMTIKRTVHKQK